MYKRVNIGDYTRKVTLASIQLVKHLYDVLFGLVALNQILSELSIGGKHQASEKQKRSLYNHNCLCI